MRHCDLSGRGFAGKDKATMKKLMFLLACSIFLGAVVNAAEKVDESKFDEKERTRRRMLRAAGIDPDKKKDEPKQPAAGAMPATAATPPGVPNEYTFNVSGMM
jgi:hypothetical protein